MSALAKQFGLAILGGAALLALAPQASAQVPYTPYDPYGTARRAAFNISLYGRALRQVPPYALGYNPYPQVYAPGSVIPPGVGTPAIGGVPGYGGFPGYGGGGGTLLNNPYGGTSAGYTSTLSTDPYGGGGGGGYGNSYIPNSDPFSGFLRGTADLISSEGRFRLQNQQARVVGQQVRQATIENRRRAFDEFMYERANTPSMQDVREQYAKLDLRYHVNNPSSTDIFSAASLNSILDQLRQIQAKGGKGPTIDLDKDLLKQINVTSGSGGNVGLLKNDGRLTWPLALGGNGFDAERKNLERDIAVAVSEAEKHGQVDRGRLKDMISNVDRMYDTLAKQIGEMTPSQYIESKRYLNMLSDALRALQTPDAGNYFTGKYAAHGKTVGELVKNMGGLRFAPAVPGEERAYRELYNALVSYYSGTQTVSTKE